MSSRVGGKCWIVLAVTGPSCTWAALQRAGIRAAFSQTNDNICPPHGGLTSFSPVH